MPKKSYPNESKNWRDLLEEFCWRMGGHYELNISTTPRSRTGALMNSNKSWSVSLMQHKNSFDYWTKQGSTNFWSWFTCFRWKNSDRGCLFPKIPVLKFGPYFRSSGLRKPYALDDSVDLSTPSKLAQYNAERLSKKLAKKSEIPPALVESSYPIPVLAGVSSPNSAAKKKSPPISSRRPYGWGILILKKLFLWK